MHIQFTQNTTAERGHTPRSYICRHRIAYLQGQSIDTPLHNTPVQEQNRNQIHQIPEDNANLMAAAARQGLGTS